MANKTPDNYKLIGMIIPAGTDKDGNLIVSACYNINKYCKDLEPSTLNYKDFLSSLLKIQNIEKNKIFKTSKGDKLTVDRDKKNFNPFEYSFENEFKKHLDYQTIKDDLWNKIFFSDKSFNFTKSIHTDSSVKIYNHKKPDLLYDLNNNKSHEWKLLNSYTAANKADTISKLSEIKVDDDSKPIINKRLELFHEFGTNSEKIAKAELKSFISRHQNAAINFKKNNPSMSKEFQLFPNKMFTKAYVEESGKEGSTEEVEIDELVHSFSSITNDPILSRLMGVIVDYKIQLNDIPQDDYFSITLNETDDVFFLNTPIRRLGDTTPSSKCFYIIENKDKKSEYFERTILKSEHTNILTYDMLSHLQNIENIRQRELSGQNTNDYDANEVLTRGLLFTHDKLDEVIAPIDIVIKDNDGKPVKFIDDDKYCEEHFVKGIRVAVNYKETDKEKVREYLYPLTSRSVELLDKKGNKIYYKGDVESCIHIDASTAYMQDGEVKSSTTPVMFEYSGELLKLKSTFAKANTQKKIHHAADASDNNHDDGLSKAEERFKKILTYYPFPLIEKEEKDSANYNCFYSIPGNFTKQKKAPQLRFNCEYSFIVNQEYQNGYGLPLKNENGLSIQAIVKSEPVLNPKFQKFYPAENKKTVTLYHRKAVNEDLSEQKIIEKPSLEHLVVRSDDGEDSNQYIDERHVLPPKIDIETGFWYGLLAKLSEDDSFEFKTRANCPFADKNAYDNFINETDENGKSKENKCAECGKSYCGGTQMEKYYSDRHIYPNHFFTDPSIKGFSIKLFWDKEFKHEVVTNYVEPSMFGGTAGIEPKSFLLRAKGAAEEAFIENHDFWEVLEVYLKKGMVIYAQLSNHYGDERGNVETHLTEGSWWNQLIETNYKFTFLNEAKNLIEAKNDVAKAARQKLIHERNKPKLISLTHAVKEPLITPEVLKLTSTPKDHKFIEHINDWLKEKDYQRYKVGISVIANRIDKTTGNPTINSSFTNVELTSHFERLDAIKKIEFLKDILPTGALELWMRKEEFADNPEQVVLSTQSETNHLPDEPVVKFSNRNNVFSLDYKIEFSNEMIIQLKNIKNIEDIDSITDVFRSLITKLNLQYDFKTTKFEEREYYLKDISQFKGFFTDEKFNDNGNIKALDKLEEFALPKIKDVMSDLGEDSKFRFKVIVLNNSQPTKPDVAFAVTTIQETRSNPSSQKTISIQKGNIVTIYLKRGRLKSGKDERVGVIVDADSLYNKLFKDNELISKAGRDIVSDRYSNRSQYLQYGDIIIPEINEYKAGFDNELGIYHFLPHFDVEKQLWKFEVELDIKTIDGKQLHNPFINFSIVHFQPFSLNYNDKTADASLLELKSDCRISDVENSTWCYLLPERKLSVFFDKPGLFDTYGEVDLTVSFDHESLHHFNSDINKWKIRSNFIVTVQGSDDGLEWQPVGSWLDDGEKTENDFGLHHPLLSKTLIENEENLIRQKLKFNKWAIPNNTQQSNKYSYFRVRFIEVEWFKDENWEELIERYKKENPELLNTDAVDNEEMRIRFVELIY